MTCSETGDQFAQIEIRIRDAHSQVWSRQCGALHSGEVWTPPVNVYRTAGHVAVCVDLAGVEVTGVDVEVAPGRLTIRGVRAAPGPGEPAAEPMRIVSMEIDHGPFCRTVPIPERVDVSIVRTEYRQGLLWIRVPLQAIG